MENIYEVTRQIYKKQHERISANTDGLIEFEECIQTRCLELTLNGLMEK